MFKLFLIATLCLFVYAFIFAREESSVKYINELKQIQTELKQIQTELHEVCFKGE